MKIKRIVIVLLCLALLLIGCTSRTDANLEVPPGTVSNDPTGTVPTGKPEPSGTNTTVPSDPTTDPTATGDSTASTKPAEAQPKPTDATDTSNPATDPTVVSDPTVSTEGLPTETPDPTTATENQPKPTAAQPKPTQATELEPSQAPKPTEAQPKPTESPRPVHQHSYKAQTVAATCTEQGYTVEVCSCGAKTEAHDYIPALGHDYQVSSEREATPWAGGYTESTCSRCGNSSRTETGTLGGEQLEAFRYDVAKAAVKYINEYRLQEGSTELTYLPGLSQVAMYRSEQLISNFKHDTKDIKQAFNHFQYGRYVDATEYGDDASLSYYTDDGNEAIGIVHLHSNADTIGKRIADGLYESKSHWRYIGSSEYSFAGAGWCLEGYCVVFVSPENYG